jgi:phage terminase large subunit-like protein
MSQAFTRMRGREGRDARAGGIKAFAASVVLIEGKASGTQLIQELVEQGLHAVTRYQPQSDTVMLSALPKATPVASGDPRA